MMVVFATHWHETATGAHVSPHPLAPPGKPLVPISEQIYDNSLLNERRKRKKEWSDLLTTLLTLKVTSSLDLLILLVLPRVLDSKLIFTNLHTMYVYKLTS